MYIGKWEERVFGDMGMEMVYSKTISQKCILIEVIKSTTENYSRISGFSFPSQTLRNFPNKTFSC